jgi:histidinol phosphatase-like PHP family hydrolase
LVSNGRVSPDYDIHIHTWLSPCGARDKSESAAAVYARAARERGLATIGVSDHFALPGEGVPKWYENNGPQIVPEAYRQAREAEADGVRVLVGLEAEVFGPGRVSIDEGLFHRVDYVILAAGHFHFRELRESLKKDPATAAEALIKYLEEAIAFPWADIIAHPLVVPENGLGAPETYLPLVSDEAIGRVARAAARAGKALEVNGAMASQEAFREHMPRFFRIVKEEGAQLTVGSDSHTIAHLGPRLDAVETFARDAGLGRSDFVDVQEILRRHQARGWASS